MGYQRRVHGLYHVNSYESANFSKSEATVSIVISKLFNVISFGLWRIEVPETVTKIARHPTDNIHKDFGHKELQLGFQFLADMINRLMFVVIILVQIGALCGTIVRTWVAYGSDDILNL